MHLVCGFAWQCSERLILAVARAVGSCPDAARSVYTAGVKGVTIEYSFVGDFHMTRSTSTLRLLLLVLGSRSSEYWGGTPSCSQDATSPAKFQLHFFGNMVQFSGFGVLCSLRWWRFREHGTRFETMAILVKALKCVTKRLRAFP